MSQQPIGLCLASARNSAKLAATLLGLPQGLSHHLLGPRTVVQNL